MNIFVIPSWYPCSRNPLTGLFFKDQALALGEWNEKVNIAISLWGQVEYLLQAKKPLYSLIILRDFFSSTKPSINFLRKNVREYNSPALTWSARLWGGNKKGMLEANRENLAKALSDYGSVDIIHAHVSYPAGLIAMHLSKESGIPYVITEHMGPFPFPHFLRKGRLTPAIENPLKHACTVIAVSPSLAERIHSFGLKAPTFIPNMVDERFFVPGGETSPARKTFFTLGGMTKGKGIPDLLHAVALIVRKGGNALFKIGGDGESLENYRGLAEKLGIASYTKWLGPLSREEVKKEYQRCTAFILPSHYETFGVVYVEALACGKPVIATRCGGPEYIVNEQNGLLTDVGDVDQIAEAILWMVKNHNKYDPAAIRQECLSKYSRQVVAGQIINVYRRCVEECAE